jgi:hypothetical protein
MSIMQEDVRARNEGHFNSRNSSLFVASLMVLVILNGPPGQGPANIANRQTGPGQNDFWISYPPSRTDQSSAVPHPSWVSSALDRGPVMIFGHIEDCIACAVQAPICSEVNLSHEGNITYFDLLGGRDEAILAEALSVYDPSDGPHLVLWSWLSTRSWTPMASG